MTVSAKRIIALVLAMVAIILASITLAGHPADTLRLLAWSAICAAAATGTLAL